MMLDALGEVRLTHPMTLIEEILASGTNSVQIRNFVTPRPRENLECYFDHLDHAINAAGIDHVCIGSDRDHRVIPDIQAEIDLLVAEEGSQFLPDQWPFYITELNGPAGDGDCPRRHRPARILARAGGQDSGWQPIPALPGDHRVSGYWDRTSPECDVEATARPSGFHNGL